MIAAAFKRELVRVERDEGLRVLVVGGLVLYLLVSVADLSGDPVQPLRSMAAQYVLLSVLAPLTVSRLAASSREEWVRQMALSAESPWLSTVTRISGGFFAISPLLLASWPVLAIAWLMGMSTGTELAELFIEVSVFSGLTLGIAAFCTMGRWRPLARWAASVAISAAIGIGSFLFFGSSVAVLSILSAIVGGSLYLRSRRLVYLDT